jgi:hypothetical protein
LTKSQNCFKIKALAFLSNEVTDYLTLRAEDIGTAAKGKFMSDEPTPVVPPVTPEPDTTTTPTTPTAPAAM